MQAKLNRHHLGLVLSLLLLNAIALFPLLTTGYCGDDILNSQIRGEMIQTHRSLWGVTAHYIGVWVSNEGRLFPLSFYMYSVFYAIRNVILYKLFVLTVVLASLAGFFLFLRKLTGSTAIPSACLLLLPLVIQFRPTWDPILGFCAQYPLLTLLMFSSLTLFLEFLDSRDRRALAIAIILFLCCGLIFETSYVMCVLFPIVAFSRTRTIRASLAGSWPFLAVTAGLASISIILRKVAGPHATAYTPNYDLALVIKAYLLQTFGAVPFSYYWLDPHRIFFSQISPWPAPIAQGLPLLVILAMITVLSAERRFPWTAATAPRARLVDLLVVGTALLALPQILISLSPKYQAMPWGAAYLPVYISCLGLTLLLATLLTWLFDNRQVPAGRRRVVLGVVLVAWTGLFALNLRHNWVVAIWENEAYWTPRVLTEKALRRGLLHNMPAGAILLVNGTHIWDNANEYSGKTQRWLSVYRLTESTDLVPAFQQVGADCKLQTGQQECEFPPAAPVYTVQIRHYADGKGAVFLAHISGAYQSDHRMVGLLADKVTAYFRMPGSIPEPQPSISGRLLQPRQGSASLFRAGAEDCSVLRRGRGWEVLSLRRDGTFDAFSLQGDVSPPLSTSTVSMAKSKSDFELQLPGLEILHQGFIGHMPDHGIEQPPITFSNEMSIDVLVTPGTEQVANANIFSNHAADFRGIAIEQRGDETNQYSIALGNGKGWMYAGNFSLQPARQNYISLQVNGRQTALYVNGALIARTILVAPIASTDRPVYIGNWIGGDRQFNGMIGEVLIAEGTRSAKEVRLDSIRILANHSAHSGGS